MDGYRGDMNTVLSQLSTWVARSAQLQELVAALDNQFRTLQAQVGELADPYAEVRSTLESRQGSVVTIETDAGPVAGTLIAVGTDFAQLLEPTGDMVFVLIDSISQIA